MQLRSTQKKKKAVATQIPRGERPEQIGPMTFEMLSYTLLPNTTLTTLQPDRSSATRLNLWQSNCNGRKMARIRRDCNNSKAPTIEVLQRKRTKGQGKIN